MELSTFFEYLNAELQERRTLARMARIEASGMGVDHQFVEQVRDRLARREYQTDEAFTALPYEHQQQVHARFARFVPEDVDVKPPMDTE